MWVSECVCVWGGEGRDRQKEKEGIKWIILSLCSPLSYGIARVQWTPLMHVCAWNSMCAWVCVCVCGKGWFWLDQEDKLHCGAKQRESTHTRHLLCGLKLQKVRSELQWGCLIHCMWQTAFTLTVWQNILRKTHSKFRTFHLAKNKKMPTTQIKMKGSQQC